MNALEVAAAVAVFAGVGLQSAVGFGFSLVCAPLVFAAHGPVQAVGLLTALGLEVNLLMLLGERRRPDPLGRLAATVLAWSVPGMLAGVAVLRSVEAVVLQLLLTATVFAGLAVRRAVPRRHLWPAPAAGLAAGALATTTTAAGPPLVLLLVGRGLAPARVRDTLTLCFLGLSLLAAGALAVTGTRAALPNLDVLAVLAPLAVLGQLTGRRLFVRLARSHYERVLTVVLAASALTGLLTTLL